MMKLIMYDVEYSKTGRESTDCHYEGDLTKAKKQIKFFNKYTKVADFIETDKKLKNKVMFLMTGRLFSSIKKVYYDGNFVSIEGRGFV